MNKPVSDNTVVGSPIVKWTTGGIYKDAKITQVEVLRETEQSVWVRSNRADPVREAAQALIDRYHAPSWKDGVPFVEFIQRLSTALAAPEGPHARPINTAPMLGNPLLLYWQHAGWMRGRFVDEPRWHGWMCDGDQVMPLNQSDCTHWMPLPTAPGAAPEAPPPVEARQPLTRVLSEDQIEDAIDEANWAFTMRSRGPSGQQLTSYDSRDHWFARAIEAKVRAALAAPAGAIQPHLDHQVGAPVTPLPLDSAGGAPSATAPREHEANEHCWCEPEVDYVDPNTGAKVFVHKQTQ